jgi:hypothetical protein
MAQDNDSTRPAPDLVEDGIPATEEQPGNVPPGWEAEEEPAPLEFPQGVEDWGTTATEEAMGESLAMRVAREEPDVAAEPDAGGVRLLEPGAEDGLMDDEADAIGEVDSERFDTLSAEEAAMRIEDEPAGLTYDATPGYLDDEHEV